MIDSPTHHVTDIQLILSRVGSSTSSTSWDDEKAISEKIRELVHGTAISSYFIRLSWVNKLKFLKILCDKINSIGSISLLLNTLHCVTGKITSYAKTLTEKPMPHDTILQDHNRTLDDGIVEEQMARDVAWFSMISDKDQVAILIGLLRISGGAITEILYKHLQKIYARRLNSSPIEGQKRYVEIKKEQILNDKLKVEPSASADKLFDLNVEIEYDPENPKHQECLKQTKLWDEMIGKYRKEVEKAAGITKAKKGKKKKEGKSKSKGKDKGGGKEKKKDGKKKISKQKNDEQPVDWIQIMPIWIVKKIFNYLDKKTLNKAKKVNEYWKWAIGDLMKEQKVKKILNKTKKHIKESCGEDICKLSNKSLFLEPQKYKNTTEKRLDKLFDRGAILEQLRYTSVGPLTEECLLLKSLEVAPFSVPYFNEITMYSRVVRSNPPLYKKPAFICKDYNIIYKEFENEDSASHISCQTFLSPAEYTSISSEEIEF